MKKLLLVLLLLLLPSIVFGAVIPTTKIIDWEAGVEGGIPTYAAGTVWDVTTDSCGVAGSNGNPGTYVRPFSTVDYATGRCTASRGDIIMVMPGHAESIASASAITSAWPRRTELSTPSSVG